MSRDPAANVALSGVNSSGSCGARSASMASLFFLMISGSSSRVSLTTAKPSTISWRLLVIRSMSFEFSMKSFHDPPMVRAISASAVSTSLRNFFSISSISSTVLVLKSSSTSRSILALISAGVASDSVSSDSSSIVIFDAAGSAASPGGISAIAVSLRAVPYH